MGVASGEQALKEDVGSSPQNAGGGQSSWSAGLDTDFRDSQLVCGGQRGFDRVKQSVCRDKGGLCRVPFWLFSDSLL